MRIGMAAPRPLRFTRTPTEGKRRRDTRLGTPGSSKGPAEERAHGSEQERQGLVTSTMLKNLVRSAALAGALLLLALAGSAGVRPF
jgi:hypothetical protein